MHHPTVPVRLVLTFVIGGHWGLVPKKYIIGKVQLRWWPLAHARMF